MGTTMTLLELKRSIAKHVRSCSSTTPATKFSCVAQTLHLVVDDKVLVGDDLALFQLGITSSDATVQVCRCGLGSLAWNNLLKDLLVAISNCHYGKAKMLLRDIREANGKHRLAHTLKTACLAEELAIAQFLFENCTADVIFEALLMTIKPKLRSHKRCHWQHMGTRCTLFRFIHEAQMNFFDEEWRLSLANIICSRLEGRKLKRLHAYESYCRSFRRELDHFLREEDLSEELFRPKPRLWNYATEQCAASLIEDVLDDATIVREGKAASKTSKRQGRSPHAATHKSVLEPPTSSIPSVSLRPLSSFSCRKQKSRFLDNRRNRDQVTHAWWWYI